MKHYPLLLLALAFVGCAPPYSAVLNSSAGLAGQMTLLGTIGPVNSPNGDSTTAIKFLPIKPSTTTTTLDQLTPVSGFLVSESPGQESLNFASQDSSGNVQTMNGGGGFSLAGADPNYPLYEYDVITTTTTANIMVYLLNGASAGNNTYQYFTATVPNGPFQAVTNPPSFMNTIFGSGAVIAAQVFPLTPPSDMFNFLVNPGTYQEGTTTFNGSAFTTTMPGVSVPLGPLGAGNRVLYYQNGLSGAASLSYASYYTAGQWVCYQWNKNATPITPLQLTGITNRIDAVLTDGDLISAQDGTLRVYDPTSGVQVLSVNLGGLQFCYEAYVGTTPYVFFSLSLGFSHQAWAFRVYAIPTSAMRGLKG